MKYDLEGNKRINLDFQQNRYLFKRKNPLNHWKINKIGNCLEIEN